MLTKNKLKVLAMFVPKRQNLSQAPHTDGTPTTRKKNEMTDIKTVTTQEELDAAMKARIEEDGWS